MTTVPPTRRAAPSRRAVLRGLVGTLLGSSVAVGAAACSSTPGTSGAGGSAAPTDPTVSGPTTTGEDRSEAPSAATADVDTSTDPHLTVVALASGGVVTVHPRPADLDDAADPASDETLRSLDAGTETTGTLVFLVLQQGAAWLEVQLPVRPNGSTGWIRTRDVSLSRHRFAVDVSLADFTLTVTRGEDVVLASDIGLGTEDTPTPGGDYYVKELLQPPDPAGVYGPYAYGLSGFSNVLTDFAGGEGVIGIHGTDDPSAIGRRVSAGCIRLPNDVVTRLVEEVGLPLGTPVTIRG